MYKHNQSVFYRAVPDMGWMEAEKEIEKEYIRMFSYFSNEMQELQKWLEMKLDQYEYDGSPMYDEYPDKTWMYSIGTAVRNEDRERFASLEENQIYMLVVWSVFYRRTKKRRANLFV